MDQIIKMLYDAKDAAEQGGMVNKDLLHFLGMCLSHYDKTKSQNFQDIWALYECDGIPHITPTTFVEFGATNGIDGSNTYLLEREYGWRGLVAEPNPVYHEDLRRNRIAPVDTRCVYNTTGASMDFLLTPASDLSTLVGYENSDYNADRRVGGQSIKVETVTLFDLLEQHQMPRDIDFVSIDTEGTEPEILAKFFEQNNGKYDITCFTIEHNFVDDRRNQILDLMVKNGYKRKFQSISRWDDFYRKVK